jgi:hypothetical protein
MTNIATEKTYEEKLLESLKEAKICNDSLKEGYDIEKKRADHFKTEAIDLRRAVLDLMSQLQEEDKLLNKIRILFHELMVS